MENRRYDYQSIRTRPALRWPNEARIAVWVSPNIEYFHIDQPIPNFGMSQVPDVRGYSQRDYGARVGVFRMMEVLDKHGIRASAQLNSEVCLHHREIVEEGIKRDWEWLGHGITNNMPLTAYPADDERSVIRQVREEITREPRTAAPRLPPPPVQIRLDPVQKLRVKVQDRRDPLQRPPHLVIRVARLEQAPLRCPFPPHNPLRRLWKTVRPLNHTTPEAVP